MYFCSRFQDSKRLKIFFFHGDISTCICIELLIFWLCSYFGKIKVCALTKVSLDGFHLEPIIS